MRKGRLILAVVCLFLYGCKYDKYEALVPSNNGYPPEVEKIIIGKCSTPGCHTTISKNAAAGLDLSSWDVMFDGTSNGAVVIPYRSDFSTLCYFTNVDSTLGLVVLPTMPVNEPALSKADYETLRDWIDAGAPS